MGVSGVSASGAGETIIPGCSSPRLLGATRNGSRKLRYLREKVSFPHINYSLDKQV
uniref:Uncharacterized protein n=1 Tax=Citrifermentans bremense TaxID=60035 RepID=A0A6S6M261_9BACT